jgi:hypothetical protein
LTAENGPARLTPAGITPPLDQPHFGEWFVQETRGLARRLAADRASRVLKRTDPEVNRAVQRVIRLRAQSKAPSDARLRAELERVGLDLASWDALVHKRDKFDDQATSELLQIAVDHFSGGRSGHARAVLTSALNPLSPARQQLRRVHEFKEAARKPDSNLNQFLSPNVRKAFEAIDLEARSATVASVAGAAESPGQSTLLVVVAGSRKVESTRQNASVCRAARRVYLNYFA